MSLITTGCAPAGPWAVHVDLCPCALTGEGNRAGTATLKVTTFNVWGLPAWLNGASPTRHARIAHELDQLGSDVVLLQEVWTPQSYAVLSQQAGGKRRTWRAAAARRKGGFLGQNGLLTLSRYPIEGAEFRPFSAARLPDSFVHKGVLKVTLAIPPEQKVNVWNVHLQDGASGRARSRQIAELVQWIEEANDGQIADIVGGDFNFTPDSVEFARFVAAVGPSVHQLARTAPLPTWDGLKTAPEAGETIDHIFVKIRPAVEEVTAQPRRIFCAARREDRLSDHLGIEALLTIRGTDPNRPPALVWRRPVAALSDETAAVRR